MSGKYSDEPIGTRHAHYAAADKGPFKCGRCVHLHSQDGLHTCDHPEVRKDAEAGELKLSAEGHPIVQPGGCCNYFR